MIDIVALRQDLARLRSAWQDAVAVARERRRVLDDFLADGTDDRQRLAELQGLLRTGVEAREAAAQALDARLAQALAGTWGATALPDELIAAVEADRPVALLPVRIETAFDGPDDRPRLLVRIFPDDVHVEQHDPELTPAEDQAGRTYWEAIASGRAHEDEAWALLARTHGEPRAHWIREVLTPVSPPGQWPLVFPAAPVRRSLWSAPALASTLPDQFVVRVRVPGAELVRTTAPVQDRVPLGPDPNRAAGDATADTQGLAALDPALAWIAAFDAATARGLAVAIDLPPGVRRFDSVTVVGVCASLAPDEAAQRVASLVQRHRYTDGAGFVEPGTPTNNLADSPAGGSPSDGDGQPRTTNAVAMARALGLPSSSVFEHLPGASRGDVEEGGLAHQLLFEATWGPYLRIQFQPGFPLEHLPGVRQHLIDHVRGGGVLPTLRIGRQPYGVLPVLPLAAWRPADRDGPMVIGLVRLLQRIRPAWEAGVARWPQGVTAYGHEAVSSRVRVRSANASHAQPWLDAIGGVDGGSPSSFGPARLMAELGLQGGTPEVLRARFLQAAPHLWLPMAAADDLDFAPSRADPATANSVLGLLLRLTARRMSQVLAPGLLAGVDVGAWLDATAAAPPWRQASGATLAVPDLAGLAVSLNPAILTAGRESAAQLGLRPVPPAAAGGRSGVTVSERIGEIATHHLPVFDRYNDADAWAGFRQAMDRWRTVPPSRWGRLTGEVLDTASHRLDAWITSVASRRLQTLRDRQPQGLTLGAWGHVGGATRVSAALAGAPPSTAPGASGGFVLAPSVRHAATAGVLRAAWLEHGGLAQGHDAPFAVGLTSRRVRQALVLADGMRTGQSLGALLGYELERRIHDAAHPPPDVARAELDWMIAPLRERFPLRVDSQENADPSVSSRRLVVDGWRLLRDIPAGDGEALRTVWLAALAHRDPPMPDDPVRAQAFARIVEDVRGSLDALADLGLAEAMYQMSGRAYERAATATDMVGRATRPPDVFDDVHTPRQAHGIDQRVLVTFSGTSERPPGWAADTPRARLAPAVDAWLASRLGPASAIVLQPRTPEGDVLPALTVADLGWSALDLAASAAAGTTARPVGPALTAAVRRWLRRHPEAAGWPAAVPMAEGDDPETGRLRMAQAAVLRLDPTDDRELLDALGFAAAWHRALGGRAPLTAADLWRSHETPPPVSAPADLLAVVETWAARVPDTPEEALRWGLPAPDDASTWRAAADRALAAARPELAAGRWASAARALLGSDAVLVGTVGATDWSPALAASVADQEALLGAEAGAVACWLQDSGRVREAAARLDEAVLADDLRPGRTVPVAYAAAQAPRRPYRRTADDPTPSARWVGLDHPAPLGGEPVLGVAVVAPDGVAPDPSGPVTGLVLDRWTEAVPDLDLTAAIAANLPAPDARAPNAILLAVPAVVGQPWRAAALFETVDEAIALARLRLVDFDGASRIPGVLPAIWIEETDLDDFQVRSFVRSRTAATPRWSIARTAGG